MKAETKIKVIIGIITVLLLASLELIVPGFYEDMIDLLGTGDVHHIAEVLQSYGAWAIIISFILDVIINIAGFLPSIFFSTANGLIFGIVPGIIISWLAETVGVIISFMLMRYILRDSAEKLIQKSQFLLKVDDFSSSNGLAVMLFARTIPYFPSGIITALGAISRISLRDYAIANLIGKFPSTALEVVVGHDAVMLHQHLDRLTIIIVVATIIYIIAWFAYKRWMKKREQAKNEPKNEPKDERKD